MTQEQKELLLIDLCMRLPYGVKVKDTYYNYDENYQTIWLLDLNTQKVRIFADEDWQSIEYIKPYLFPMSSMTKEQSIEYGKLCERYCPASIYSMEIIDWFNKNHFDYRGLIPMGLANDATELNIY